MKSDINVTDFLKKVFSYNVESVKAVPPREIEGYGLCPYMLCMGFGKTGNDKNFRVKYSLHIQTKWRLSSASGDIIVADDDLFEAAYNNRKGFFYKMWKWYKENLPMSICDFMLCNFMDLSVDFSNGDTLEIFNDTSEETEIWRIVPDEGKQLVVCGNGRTAFL